MSNTTLDLENYVIDHMTDSQVRFASPANVSAIAERLRSYGIAPTEVGLSRAIDELVKEKKISRTDGGSETSDRVAAEAAEQERIRALVSAPFTQREVTTLMCLSPRELQSRYYADRDFRARYDAAVKQFGFRVPPPPETPEVDSPDTGQWAKLTAIEYHRMQSSEIVRLYRSTPSFRKAVDRLIRGAEI